MAKGWKRGFIKALAASGIVTWAAAVVKKSRSTVYEAKAKDPEFATAWDDAIEEAIDAIEMEARRRAMGYDEPVFYKGVECGKIRRYSDALLMFLLKAYRPEKYSERFRAEHTGSTTVHVKYADDVAMSRGWTVRALDDDSSDPAASTSSSAGA